MMLPENKDMAVLLVRTDYSDDAAWQFALTAATAAYENANDFPRYGANFIPVESPELDGLGAAELIGLPRSGYLSLVAVADAQTMRDQTIAFVNLNEYSDDIGRTFRAIPLKAEPIAVNLGLANMDFHEYADSADADGVFRGF